MFFVTRSQCNVKLPGLTCRIFFYSVLHWNFSWTSMPCLLPENVNKSKQHYFWDNNLCEGVDLGKIEKNLEFNLILPIISILLKALRQLIQWKLRSLGVPPVNLNPLSPNGVQHQFSPNHIHWLSRDLVMRINKLIT